MHSYDRFGGGVVTEGGACGWDIGRVLGFVEWLFGWGCVLLGDDVVNRLLHARYLLFIEFIIYITTRSKAR